MLLFDLYLKNLNKTNATEVGSDQRTSYVEKKETEASTNPILGKRIETTQTLDKNGNVKLASVPAKAKVKTGLEVEGAKKEYVKVDVANLPKKNVFYNTLEQYHPGFKKASAEEKKEVFVEYLKHVDPSQRKEVISKLHENGYFAEVDQMMVDCNKELGADAIDTNHVALTEHQNKAIKHYEQNLVAKNYTKAQGQYQNTILKDIYKNADKDAKLVAAENTYNVDKKYQVESARITAKQGDQDVAVAGAGVTYKFAKENQVEAVKLYRALNLEKVDLKIATNEGKYDKDNQKAIYKSLMGSKYESVLKTAANGIYTLDKDNQTDAVKMTLETGNKDAIKLAKENIEKYDTKNREEISNTIKNYKPEEQTKTTASNNSNTQSTTVAQKEETKVATATTTQAKSKTSEVETKLAEIKSQPAQVQEQAIMNLLNTSNEHDRKAILLTLSPEEAIHCINNIKNPTSEEVELGMTLASKLSQKNKKALVINISKQHSDNVLASLLSKSDSDIQETFFNTYGKQTSVLQYMDKKQISSKLASQLNA